ncbi:uncharacterized protein [Physcomitrium patens]|uniref:Nucleoside phosphorylase domain-containing protein n=1 Tax=Physcomitrium patens TaxID=3218 RepID=A0A2K1JXI0_PHYPA|nr:uncharacterized protein LOC112287249 [Physcomitrium patens]PNR46234.1 hypothetical protein PHYPA_013353 [Physcomitrium patens]|eukprot:XP_024385844.1 uncharacterized protein LOC112287249 [Physcomitrella patens]
MAKGLLPLLLLLLTARLRSTCCSLTRTKACLDELSGAEGYTVLMVADPGEFSGVPEAVHFEESLQNPVYIPRGSLLCPRVTVGKLMGQPTIVATSGIGPTTAALCAIDLAKCLGSRFKELIYVGTSGWSAAVGGILNPDNCEKANPTHKITRLGDVCVTPMSMNWNCKLADWIGQAKGYPDLCFSPEEINGPTAAYLYGDCIFDTHTAGSLALADEILAASITSSSIRQAPLRNTFLQEYEQEYFAYISASTNRTYNLNSKKTPTVYDYRQCVEVDSQFFYSGVPWEITARNYTALTINQAFNSSVTPKDVVAVSAMEAVGVAQAIDAYNALNATKSKIPYVFVRGNSDWLHQPVTKSANGTWTHVSPELPTVFTDGYRYAIATTSNVVLSLMSQRCKELTWSTNSLCVYTIDYS